MELQYEYIDWSDIAEAELSGDQETLRILRDRSMEIKLQAEAHSENAHVPSSPVSRREATNSSRNGQQSPSRNRGSSGTTKGSRDMRTNYVDTRNERLSNPPEFSLPSRLSKAEYPFLGQRQNNDENILPPFTTSSPCSTVTSTSYAQMVNRNPKRTLMDRCLSPTDAPLKRSATSDIMTTPTEFKTFSHDVSPSCETTPETNSNSSKAGLVQRRLFGTQQEQTKPQPREQLTDGHRLAQRQKQIDFGKNTVGYERYLQLVPKWKRQKSHPMTPDKFNSCSTRSWQGQIRVWRRQLHKYDPLPQQHFTVHDAALCNIELN